MARLKATEKGLYYLTPFRIVAGVAALFNIEDSSPGPVSVARETVVREQSGQRGIKKIRLLDPSAGKGMAAHFLAHILHAEHGALVETYGVELNSERAEIARTLLDHVLCADTRSMSATSGCFDILWVNPPYDDTREAARRLELVFLEKVTPYLRAAGTLIFIIPQAQLGVCAGYLSREYKNIKVYRFPEPEVANFGQIVVLATKRRSFSEDAEMTEHLKQIAYSYRESRRLSIFGGNQRENTIALPVLPCPTLTELRASLEGCNIQDPELSAELEGLENPEEELETGYPPTPIFHLNDMTRKTKEDKRPPVFRLVEYSWPQALRETETGGGVWSNKALRLQVNPSISTGQRMIRPAIPMREGQMALLAVTGLLDNQLLTDKEGKSYLVKGRISKKFVFKNEKTNDEGETVAIVEREQLETSITLLNLFTGALEVIPMEFLGDFVERFGPSIRRAVVEKYPPLYTPGVDDLDPEIERMKKMLTRLRRSPMRGQAPAIIGTTLLLKKGNAILAAEQGSGKTLMGAAAIYLGGFPVALVVCPPHLTGKWVREIKETIPGAEAMIVKTISDLEEARRRIERHKKHQGAKNQSGEPVSPFVLVMSRERAKLGPARRAGVVYHPPRPYPYEEDEETGKMRLLRDEDGNILFSPHCPRCDIRLRENDRDISPVSLQKKKHTCPGCSEPLWQVCAAPLSPGQSSGISAPGGVVVAIREHRRMVEGLQQRHTSRTSARALPRRVALVDYMVKKMPDLLGELLLIVDEAHEYKNKDSAQGIVVGALAEKARRTLLLTGTFSGGYSSTLFMLLWRFLKSIREEFAISEEERFVARYGILERTTHIGDGGVSEHGAVSDRRTTNTTMQEKAGINPQVLPQIIGQAVFLNLKDVASDLPPYKEYIHALSMTLLQASAYRRLSDDLYDEVNKQLAMGGMGILGALIQALLGWVDRPFEEEEVYNKRKGYLVARAPALSGEEIYPKEKELQDLYLKQKSRGRNMLVFVSNTETRDITPRVKEVLERVGARVAVLKSKAVKPDEREAWVQVQLAKGCDVLVTNPRNVQTGLDLMEFPCLVFWQIEYSIYVVQQASRRSWRIGQTEPIEVHHYVYAGTLQEQAIKLISSKYRSAKMLEGNLADQSTGLGEMGADVEDSLMLMLAKRIVAEHEAREKGEEEVLEGTFSLVDEMLLEEEEEVVQKEEIIYPVLGKDKRSMMFIPVYGDTDMSVVIKQVPMDLEPVREDILKATVTVDQPVSVSAGAGSSAGNQPSGQAREILEELARKQKRQQALDELRQLQESARGTGVSGSGKKKTKETSPLQMSLFG